MGGCVGSRPGSEARNRKTLLGRSNERTNERTKERTQERATEGKSGWCGGGHGDGNREGREAGGTNEKIKVCLLDPHRSPIHNSSASRCRYVQHDDVRTLLSRHHENKAEAHRTHRTIVFSIDRFVRRERREDPWCLLLGVSYIFRFFTSRRRKLRAQPWEF